MHPRPSPIAASLYTLRDMNVDVIIMHGPHGCCFRTGRLLESDGVRVLTTAMAENDFILGASEKLENTLKEAYDMFKPEFIGVVGTCASMIIGEDLKEAIANANLDCTVIPVESHGGFGEGDKMNKNVAIILSIAAIFITATCVGATVINSDVDMKQNTFDGIKINVPHDTEFIQIPDGFKENTYGITIHTFKDNQSMVNFLNSLQDAKIVSLADQPPQSVAFTQGDTTNILVTNGKEGICVGASDQNLVLKMANSVIFSNGHPSERNHGVMGVGQKHLDKDKDFNLMVGLMIIVDNSEFNINLYNTAIAATVTETNTIIDNNNFNFEENITSDPSSENMTAPEENNLTQEECEEMVNDYLEDTNCSISSVDENDGVYTFHIETQDGQSAGVITVDSQTGEMNTEEFEIPEESDEDMYSDLNAYDMESFDYDMESFDF